MIENAVYHLVLIIHLQRWRLCFTHIYDLDKIDITMLQEVHRLMKICWNCLCMDIKNNFRKLVFLMYAHISICVNSCYSP